MINRKTVLVLGAGASCPYGFPVGAGLRRMILSLRDGILDEEIRGNGQIFVKSGLGERFIEEFRRSEFPSIDAFLARRPEFAYVGKLAIAKILLPLENYLNLADGEPEDHWYRYLINRMDAAWDEFENNNISIVTFNYDRSLEVFLLKALRARYGRSEAEALAKVKALKIVHVYGSLGSIDPADRDFVPYGGHPDSRNVYHAAASGLQVIPEGRDDAATFTEARELLNTTDAIVFLGFGFDEINVNRLGGHRIRAGWRDAGNGTALQAPFAASAFGMTGAEIGDAAVRLGHSGGDFDVRSRFIPAPSLDVLRQTLILE